ncbi:hypothetical protein [Oceanobacillus sp. CAU 1775]
MSNLEGKLLNKMEIVDLKYHVLSIFHSLQFDEVYDKEDCIKDLSKLLKQLDENEPPYSLMITNNNRNEIIESTVI